MVFRPSTSLLKRGKDVNALETRGNDPAETSDGNAFKRVVYICDEWI
jgi:hypothetical protein